MQVQHDVDIPEEPPSVITQLDLHCPSLTHSPLGLFLPLCSYIIYKDPGNWGPLTILIKPQRVDMQFAKVSVLLILNDTGTRRSDELTNELL